MTNKLPVIGKRYKTRTKEYLPKGIEMKVISIVRDCAICYIIGEEDLFSNETIEAEINVEKDPDQELVYTFHNKSFFHYFEELPDQEPSIKKRLYFTCPIVALYMMKEFGVKVNLFNSQRLPANENKLYRPNVPKSELYSEMVAYLQFCIDKNGKVYIAKESESIFEAKLDELGLDEDGNICQYYEGNIAGERYWGIKDAEEYENGVRVKGDVRIIMRDNIQFFMPEVESE